jgi:hypothetical protein
MPNFLDNHDYFMKPAVGQAGAHLLVLGHAHRVAAAMEPTLERREHMIMVNAAQAQESAPPWSRRQTAGALAPTPLLSVLQMPQWSPAVERLEHDTTVYLRGRVGGAPQWSPPLTGGNTRVACVLGGFEPLAAMEPAFEWREQVPGLLPLSVHRGAAMEPAVGWREHQPRCSAAASGSGRNGAPLDGGSIRAWKTG